MNRESATAWSLGAVGAAQGLYNYYVKPNPGAVAWAVLGASILAYDAFCPTGQTMSETVDRGLDTHRLLVLGGIALTAGHLANIIPQPLDPLHRGSEAIRHLIGK